MDFTRKYGSLILMIGSLGMLFSSVVVFGMNKLDDTKLKAVPPNQIKEKLELKQKKEKKLKQKEEDLKIKKKEREKKTIELLNKPKEQMGKELILNKLKEAVEKINASGDGVVNRAVAIEVFRDEEIQVILTEMGRDSRASFLSKIICTLTLKSKKEKELPIRIIDLINTYIYEVQKGDGFGYNISLEDIKCESQKNGLSLLYQNIKQKVDQDVRLTEQVIKKIFEESPFKDDYKKLAELYWDNDQNKLLEDLEEYSDSRNNSNIANVISMYRNRQKSWF